MCFEPLILAGYLWTVQYNHFHRSKFDGAIVEVQSCERGVGLDLKASPEGIYGVALQYGLSTKRDTWTFTLTPKLGVGYVDHRVPEQTSQTNFNLGLQAMVGYGRSRLAVEYWHQSNAGLGDRNAGLDLIAVMGGLSF